MEMKDILKLAAEIAVKLGKDENLMDAFKKDPVTVIDSEILFA